MFASLPGRKIRTCQVGGFKTHTACDFIITPWLPCVLYGNTSSNLSLHW
jgi:hypothetical protein